ncbi:type II toxin-antitoxin system VapC family toxin [Vitreoscilla massiliensis]|uniref:Type II toxin-antitoxin system VapC family toxin n=1 Tax=Vitreoscilla massiliensis TaxID=1689272 RepID=A0ABY4E167_9NEIS|nr:type II toxin-antitoxin system VapC family toxin [Vitreoscilla massiliensis]UOO89068.1 type II toxin-antitoxin system VapC family toxin [Vitreoscilla massiliensis]
MLLLDTNVISELRKVRTNKADENFKQWAEYLDVDSLYISAISIMELEMGILQKERKDSIQGAILRNWFETQVIPTFAGRILSIDTKVALACARLHIPNPRFERDALIAATALVNGLTIVTRNTKDFEKTGVTLINPFLCQFPAKSE